MSPVVLAGFCHDQIGRVEGVGVGREEEGDASKNLHSGALGLNVD